MYLCIILNVRLLWDNKFSNFMQSVTSIIFRKTCESLILINNAIRNYLRCVLVYSEIGERQIVIR